MIVGINAAEGKARFFNLRHFCSKRLAVSQRFGRYSPPHFHLGWNDRTEGKILSCTKFILVHISLP